MKAPGIGWRRETRTVTQERDKEIYRERVQERQRRRQRGTWKERVQEGRRDR